MLHIREEGEPIQNGFNFYPLSDNSSFGFVFRWGSRIPLTNLGLRTFWVRYSKITKKWSIKDVDQVVGGFIN